MPRSFGSSSLYKAARTVRTVEQVSNGKGGKRVVNVAKGRALRRAGFWRWLWGGVLICALLALPATADAHHRHRHHHRAAHHARANQPAPDTEAFGPELSTLAQPQLQADLEQAFGMRAARRVIWTPHPLHLAACPIRIPEVSGAVGGCVPWSDLTVWVDPAQFPPHAYLLYAEWIYAHEEAHVFDRTAMTDQQRSAFEQIMGYPGQPWDRSLRADYSPPLEQFADVYADCAVGDISASSYGEPLSASQFAAACAMLRP